MSGGESQSELGARLEAYYQRRSVKSELAEWERDEAFMALAMTLWPADFEIAYEGYRGQSARQRLRLRHEGFRAIIGARLQIAALHGAAVEALEKLNAS